MTLIVTDWLARRDPQSQSLELLSHLKIVTFWGSLIEDEGDLVAKKLKPT